MNLNNPIVQNGVNTLVSAGIALLSGWAAVEYTSTKVDSIQGAVKSAFSQLSLNGVGESVGNELRNFTKIAVKVVNEAMQEGAEGSVSMQQTLSSGLFYAWAPYLAAYGVIVGAAPLAYKYAYDVLKHNIGKPVMAQETRVSYWYTPIVQCVGSLNPFKKAQDIPKPIFSPEIEEQVNDIVLTTKNIIKNGGNFENVLLFGPPGTGKSMIAEYTARASNMDYYMMSAAELTQFIQRKEHISELNKLLNNAESSRNGAIIFIDEVDAIAGPRDELDQEHIEIINTLLKRTGFGSKKIMLMAATNREVDAAFSSRMSQKIYIGLPALEERKKIIAMYASQLFSSEEVAEFFDSEKIALLASRLDGFSGRSISQMMNTILNKKFATDDGKLSQAIIDLKVAQYIKQEKA